MLRTVQFACTLSKAEADALNAERGRIYTARLVRHHRVYRKQGVWLAPRNGERLDDAPGGATTLHAHSRAAAQPGFYTACTTARACQQAGLDILDTLDTLDTTYPPWRKRWRSTLGKKTGMSRRGERVGWAQARGVAPVAVLLPSTLVALPAAAFLEVRLVWDRAAQHDSWHVVVADGVQAAPAPGTTTAAVDLGEIHPAALTDGNQTGISSCRALRATHQYTATRRAEIRAKQDRKKKHSRSWKRLHRRTSRFLAKQKRRARDLEHKISRAVVTWARGRRVGTLVIGDVRDVADGKRLQTKSQQKMGLWSHGRQRHSITYKAEAAGIVVTLVDEAYTSQICPGTLPDGSGCVHCYKPQGARVSLPGVRLYSASRRTGCCANLLSQHFTGEPGHVWPPKETYRDPFVGKRSRLDTAELARIPTVGYGRVRQAAGLHPSRVSQVAIRDVVATAGHNSRRGLLPSHLGDVLPRWRSARSVPLADSRRRVVARGRELFQQVRTPPGAASGRPANSFLWSEPRVAVPFHVGRGCKIVDLATLLA